MNYFEKENQSDEVDLFDISEIQKIKADTTDQSNVQVDLFEYAEQCENPPAKIDFDQSDSQSLNENKELHKRGKKLKTSNKIAIAAVAVILTLSILITGGAAIFINYYNKLNYAADDADAYYYNNLAEDIMSSPNVTNVLLIGTDERTKEFSDNARSDCTMIMSVNQKTHTISLISLERGMTVKYLKSENEYSSDLLTHVFKRGGAGLLMNTVQNSFKVEVKNYVRVNFNTFEQIIDKLGGIDVELSWDEVRGLNTEKHPGQVVKRTLKAGENHLNGEEALLYARLRWIDSDFRRVERQRKVILSVKKKIKGASYSQLMDMANDILPLVRTNISANDMAKLLFNVCSALGNDTQQMTLPAEGTFTGLASVNFDKNAEILQQTLYGKTNLGDSEN